MSKTPEQELYTRLSKGWKMSDLAKRIGLSRDTGRRWEKRQAVPLRHEKKINALWYTLRPAGFKWLPVGK